MRRIITILVLIIVFPFSACSSSGDETRVETASDLTVISNDIQISRISGTENPMESSDILKLNIGDTVLTAVLADNSSVEALIEILSDGPLTIDMRDYGSMEKVGPLPESLPGNDQQITTEAGDLILYQGNSFVIYYEPNSWNFTRLGKINNITAEELKMILGDGNVAVTLSLD